MTESRAIGGRPRPVPSVLDTLRARVDPASFDAIILSLEAVAADLGYGDVRALAGSIAWVDQMHAAGKKVGVISDGEGISAALSLAGIEDRFDCVLHGPHTAATLSEAAAQLDADVARTLVVDASEDGIAAAREAGAALIIAVARGAATPERLRRAGANAVVADLQELLAPAAP